MRRPRYVQLSLPLGDVPREVWYRFDDPYHPGEELEVQEFRVVRRTDKCVVLDVYGLEKLVLKEARRRFAYPTKELALQSYLIRKAKQIGYAVAAHDRAKDNRAVALELAERWGLRLQGERLVAA